MLNWLPALIFLIAQGTFGPGGEIGRADLAKLLAHSARIQSVCMAAAALAAKSESPSEASNCGGNGIEVEKDSSLLAKISDCDFSQMEGGLLTAITPRDGPRA